MRAWHPIAKLLHWVMAALLLSMIGCGFLMAQTAAKGDFAARVLGLRVYDLYQLHKSIGVSLFALLVLRVVWRALHRPPPFPQGMSAGVVRAAKLTHLGLYVLMATMPLTGWLMASSSPLGIPTVVFGVLPIPHLVGPDAEVSAFWGRLHWMGGVSMLALVTLHVAGALKHHFVDRDDVLRHMLPFGRRLGWVVVLILPFAFVHPALAQTHWKVDPAKSTLAFEVKIGTSIAFGTFSDWTAHIQFDPQDQNQNSVQVQVSTATASISAPQAAAPLAGSSWLDADAFPVAEFVADSLTWDGQHLTVPGTLTLKGVTLPLVLSGTLDIAGSTATAQLRSTLSRHDFGIGDANPAVSTDVIIAVSLTAHRVQ
ncbi:cytochrome b/b6 domain-containing protein [Actibacterium mucosum]|nr:cytochrome b/b6 domain-containing protein [Actibacterium mucosum]